MRWQLSFCDASRPKGEQFLGSAIVEALDMIEAVKVSHAQGINPGNCEVAMMDVDEDAVARLSFDLQPYMWRLLSKTETLELSDRIVAELGS